MSLTLECERILTTDHSQLFSRWKQKWRCDQHSSAVGGSNVYKTTLGNRIDSWVKWTLIILINSQQMKVKLIGQDVTCRGAIKIRAFFVKNWDFRLVYAHDNIRGDLILTDELTLLIDGIWETVGVSQLYLDFVTESGFRPNLIGLNMSSWRPFLTRFLCSSEDCSVAGHQEVMKYASATFSGLDVHYLSFWSQNQNYF